MQRTLRLPLVALLFGSILGSAQIVSFGVRAGIPINNLISAGKGRSASTEWYAIGPTIEVKLPFRFAVSSDFLYVQIVLGLPSGSPAATVHRWGLPVLLKYDVASAPARPFVHAGISFNRIFGVESASECGLPARHVPQPPDKRLIANWPDPRFSADMRLASDWECWHGRVISNTLGLK